MLDAIFRKTTGVLLLALLLVAAGGFLITELPIQLYPQTQRPRVRTTIDHTGISAIDFAGEYGEEIEARLLAIDGADILEVEYENDRSSFTITLNDSGILGSSVFSPFTIDSYILVLPETSSDFTVSIS